MGRHDASYRLLFGHRRMVADLLRGFVHEPWVEELNFGAMERVNASFVSQHLGRREGDVVWRLKTRAEEPVDVLVLLEFQSEIDRFMVVRMMAYVALLYQDLIARGELTGGGRLPPVYSIVIYNGWAPWRAGTELSALVAEAPAELDRHQPRLSYRLIDLERCSAGEIDRPGNLAAAMFNLERSRRGSEAKAAIGRLVRCLGNPDDGNLRRAFAVWLHRVILPGRVDEQDLPEVLGLEEFRAMLEQRVLRWNQELREEGFAEGRREGRQEGRQEGRRQGEAALLCKLLELKFGPLDARIRARIEAADANRILTWGERFVTADSVDDVFAAP